MAVTILEALQNADYNMNNNGNMGLMIGRPQLHNAVVLLEKGYDISEEIEPLLEKYGTVELAPDAPIYIKNAYIA